MTENEAIKVLVAQKQCIEKSSSGQCKINCGDCKKNIPIAYQEKSYEVAISALREIQQYRKIGTVEECREAMEKQNYMKIKTIEDMCFECPKCKELVAHDDGWNTYNYCPNCGQKLSGIE